MMADIFGIGAYAALLGYILGAVLAAGAGAWVARYGEKYRPDRVPILAACATIVAWCVVSATLSPENPLVELATTARNLALIAVIFRLFAADGRVESLKPTRPLIIALALVQLFQPVLLFVEMQTAGIEEVAQLVFEVSLLLNMLVAIGALMLLHNLYAGAATTSRRIFQWSGTALAVIFGYDLNLYTLAYLWGDHFAVLVGLRGILTGSMAILLAIGASAAGAGLQFRPSRAVTFQTLSLLVIGSYLLVMVLVARSLSLLGGDIARTGQVLFVVLAGVAAMVWLPSERLRGWLRVTATKHLFQHRYDYREEWLRFTRTISEGSGPSASLHERAIKAIADITDSPAGLLLVPDEEAQLSLTARWNWPTVDVPAAAGDYALSALLEQHSHILDLDEVRAGVDHHGELHHVPEWLRHAEDAWALVPLIHFDRLVGAVVLAHPRIERRLDWEDFDLLRVVGQQLASYLAEQSGQQALMEASRFDEFNRRMAFVMHDIKNLASQLSLVSANAQKHADNPEFRADMLVTLRNSAEKLNALLARLNRYGAGQVHEPREIDLAVIASNIAERFKSVHPVKVANSDRSFVMADTESLEQALIHLVQNAVDASVDARPVELKVIDDGNAGAIEITDRGAGMTPEFVRNGLFKPFVSSKQGGFGIGAFEAREMIKAMGGRVSVESREGAGTKFTVSLRAVRADKLPGHNVRQEVA